MNVRHLLLLAAVTAICNGCAPSYVNLTPRTVPPTPTEVYPFEVQWDTSRRGANNADVKAYVMIDENLYPMQRMLGTRDRWEASVPIPPGKDLVPYRYKFDYTYPALTHRVPDSDVSPPYFLDRSQPLPATPPKTP